MADISTEIRFERFPRLPPGTGSRSLVALVVSFVLFGPYLANVSRDYTRVCYFWRLEDTFALVLLVAVLAAVIFGLGEAIRSTRRALLIRVFDHAVVLGLALGVLANASFFLTKLNLVSWAASPRAKAVGCGALFLLVSLGFLCSKVRLVKICEQMCLIVSPAIPLTFITLFAQQDYPGRMDPMPVLGHECAAVNSSSDRFAGGVYVFLFDEWSYGRTFENGRVMPRFSRLAEFSNSATVYEDAHSPAGNTEASVPGLLFQTADSVVVDRGRFGFSREGRFVSARDCQSIFSRIEPLGFHSALVGFSLPYGFWLGDDVDVCRVRCYYPRGEDALSTAGLHLLHALRYSPDPWSHRWYKRMETRSVHSVICTILDSTRRDVGAIVREWPANTFLMAHVHLPHMPALMNADLTFRSPHETAWRDDDPAGYESNLLAVDAVAGEFIAELRAAGKYDNSLVIFTSDHNWRKDPLFKNGGSEPLLTHVPLLVKAPGQTESASVSSRFETKNLGALIESLIAPQRQAGTQVVQNHPE